MADRVYFGVTPSAFVSPGARFRLGFRDVQFLLGGVRDPRWEARVNKFVEVLPGSTQLAFPFPPPARDDVQRVCVVDVQLMTNIPALPVSQVMDRIANAFPNTQLVRVWSIPPQGNAERVSSQAAALAAVAEVDAQLDAQGGGIFGWVKGAGMWVIIVLALILAIVYYGRVKRAGSV
jgi:hypothetical protein